MNNLIEDSNVILSKDIDRLSTKAEREKLLQSVYANIQEIESKLKKLSSQNKKKNNNYKKRSEKAELNKCEEELLSLRNLFEKQSEKVRLFKEFQIQEVKTNRETNLHRTKNSKISPQLRQLYAKEDEVFKQGVNTVYDIKNTVVGLNVTLDEVADLVHLQRQKLLSINSQIGESQSIMKRSQKIIRLFSKELYQDKIIKVLLGTITVILLLIMISAIKFKMKSGELIGKEIESQDELIDFTDIDESLFWKTIIEEKKNTNNIIAKSDEDLKTQARMITGSIDLIKLDSLRRQSGFYDEQDFQEKKYFERTKSIL